MGRAPIGLIDAGHVGTGAYLATHVVTVGVGEADDSGCANAIVSEVRAETASTHAGSPQQRCGEARLPARLYRGTTRAPCIVQDCSLAHRTGSPPHQILQRRE